MWSFRWLFIPSKSAFQRSIATGRLYAHLPLPTCSIPQYRRSYVTFKKKNLKKVTSLLSKEVAAIKEKIDTHDKLSLSEKAETHHSPFSEADYTQIYEALSTPLLPPSQRKFDPLLDNLSLSFNDTQRIETAERSNKGLPSVTEIKAVANAENSLTVALEVTGVNNVEDFNRILCYNIISKRYEEVPEIIQLMNDAKIAPDIQTYDHLLSLYAIVGDVEKAKLTFEQINRDGMSHSMYSYGNLIKAYVKNLRIDEAFAVYESIKKAGLVPTQAGILSSVVPIFTTLMKGCIDIGDVPRAWRTFDIMRLEVCQPDEVSYSLMIHACAKTQDAEKAFDVFEEMIGKGLYPTEMREYGYQPDRISYNSLIYACAKTGDVRLARMLLKQLLEDANAPNTLKELSDGTVSLPEKTALSETSTASESTALAPDKGDDNSLVHLDSYPFLSYEPVTDKQILAEARMMFEYVKSMSDNNSNGLEKSDNEQIQLSAYLMDAYMNVFHKKGKFNDVLSLYKEKLPELGIPQSGWIYSTMLKTCYKHRRYEEALRVWEDWKSWWGKNDNSDQMTKIGRTTAVQYEVYQWMINTLARCNDLSNAIYLLQELASMQTPKLADFRVTYQVAVQTENEEARRTILDLCPTRKKKVDVARDILAVKWKGTTKGRWDVHEKKRDYFMKRN
ncbi:6458_t:CDS:10 [Paraglomus occultum]|uniref:6458_t:CDS:1 n=1 Tax=Paraglomus occultum TaxID=144539 RepID=A0A9N8W4P7_9GLOM|nr:6458_t:CDS:10 [Paraglomus occultum]